MYWIFHFKSNQARKLIQKTTQNNINKEKICSTNTEKKNKIKNKRKEIKSKQKSKMQERDLKNKRRRNLKMQKT